jgi:hypothetical protein
MTDANISTMTSAEAQTRLDQLAVNPDWGRLLLSKHEGATAEFHTLSRRAAGLDAASPAPASNTAQAALDNFVADPAVGKKLLAGDPDVNRRFHELTAAVANSDRSDQLTELILGHPASERPQIEVVSGHLELTSREKERAISQFRESGVDGLAILEAFNGTLATPVEIAKAKALRTQLMADPEWCSKLLAGGYEQRRQLRLMSIILAGEI